MKFGDKEQTCRDEQLGPGLRDETLRFGLSVVENNGNENESQLRDY